MFSFRRTLFVVVPVLAAIAVPCRAQQVQQGQSSAALPPSPIARIELTPRNRTVTAGDSLQLRARAVDAAVGACAAQLGPARELYATRDSVAETGAIIREGPGQCQGDAGPRRSGRDAPTRRRLPFGRARGGNDPEQGRDRGERAADENDPALLGRGS